MCLGNDDVNLELRLALMNMNKQETLNFVKQVLVILDEQEAKGVAVNEIRADLSAVADQLESSIQADWLSRRQRALAVAAEAPADFDDSLSVNL